MAQADDTPLMRQWREVKSQHRDALVFFRVGDFYELFFQDAEEGSKLLGLTLTSRNNGAASRVPLAGIPVKALDEYLGRLVALGQRVAICEQVEDPAEANGIVRREVVETVTPGTVMSDALLSANRNNFLATLTVPVEGRQAIAALDLSTGELLVQELAESEVEAELGRLEPSELLLPRSEEDSVTRTSDDTGGVAASPFLTTYRDDWLFDFESASEEVLRRYAIQSLDAFGFQKADALLVRATGALLSYVREIRPSGIGHLKPPQIMRSGGAMVLDEMTLRNLELVEPLRPGQQGGTLLSVLDETVTAMGARLLRRWVLRPMIEAEPIWSRQEAVEELVESRDYRGGLRERLACVTDLERLAGKLGSGRVSPRDLAGLARSLDSLPALRSAGESATSSLLASLAGDLDPLTDVADRLRAALSENVPATLQEGGVIREGYSEELDQLRRIRDGARDFIATLQVRERERTGIQSLKVGFNKVFGYYLEITKANVERVPEDYVRKQTLANAERYFTPELKEWEEKVFGAEDSIAQLEAGLFSEVRRAATDQVVRIQDAGARVAQLDVLAALAHGAVRRGYVRPIVHSGFESEIEGGRHPVVETMMPRESFIPNDVVLDDEKRIVILTGPNMAGKSTVLRQVGLIHLMAQMGGFVPADAARLPVCDRIFTRVGASDNLTLGQSTFMVEMNETAAIIHGATERSLILLDEIGRGTSTYDGVSIAWAVAEHIHQELGAKTIFATHYHELTQLGDLLPGVKNLNVAVREVGHEIVFLRRLEEGGADRSYGIQVARLAGLPDAVIARAGELLAELEGTHSGGGGGLGRTDPPDQLSFFQGSVQIEEPLVVRRLAEMDLDRLSPLEALNLLFELKTEIGSGEDD
ncbi:MAG: DNA mismatch repair protein MutS [Gemmatimonadota bacterium]|nr:MAG: DNA mismatch repair protein MutS [Gemmatimonadota bacterium]